MRALRHVRIAAVQLDTREEVTGNLAQATTLIRQAARSEVSLIALPEHVLYIGPDPQPTFSLRSPEVLALCALAQVHRVWLLVGSVQERSRRRPQQGAPHRHYNTSLVIRPDGSIAARYRKIHQFQCRLPNGRSIREESLPGRKSVVAETPFGTLGLSICYDLRMPELYGRLARRGATLLAIPSNFTAFTGAAHWETLLRARAIENQAFVIAPAQCGMKSATRSFGHTMIVDPWGRVLAERRADSPGIVVATLDLRSVDHCRTRLPALHDRFATR
ncbi:MAG: carbon-nitrogen hydrolase family protein [Deltaproteobacteria bacterium]|nr:carbon-nitrogen hydrolase family protein [Deltaproteobacteria bacterium]